MGVAVIFFKILNSPPKRSRAQPVARRKIETTTGQQCPKLLHLGEWKMGVYGSYKDSFGFLKLFHSISFKTWPCEPWRKFGHENGNSNGTRSSWVVRFPIYFPLRTPVNLKRGQKLTSRAAFDRDRDADVGKVRWLDPTGYFFKLSNRTCGSQFRSTFKAWKHKTNQVSEKKPHPKGDRLRDCVQTSHFSRGYVTILQKFFQEPRVDSK